MQYFGKGSQNPAYLFSMAFGKVLRKLRKDRGLSQAELAKLVGLRQSAIANYEGGKRSLDVETVLAFTRALRVSLEELSGEKDMQTLQERHRVHRNARSVKIQEIFEALPPQDQKAVLRHALGLSSSKQKNH